LASIRETEAAIKTKEESLKGVANPSDFEGKRYHNDQIRI
jgi:hypothetical protein